ncbi:Uncharacterised protein [Achromobacter denitrificans]|nr:hypothetical protein LMG1231_03166 [Achromobacter denitrificans]SUU14531.1 Uncharacterised protein [Achromobacter denitrificans]
MPPGVVHAPEQEGEAAAAMRKAQLQAARDAFEGARQDQRQDAELGFRRHGDQPGQHPSLHAAVGHHVPGMDQHGDVVARAMNQELHQGFVVQVAGADVVADLHAQMAGRARARRFAAGQVQVLQRHLRQRLQARRRVGAVFERQVVHARGPVGRGLRGIAVAEHDGGGAQDLHVHAVPIHLPQPQARVPERGVHRAEGLVAGHDLAAGAVAFRAQPGRVDGVERGGFLPRDRREEVRMHVDFLDHSGAGASPLPGWIAPQAGQRRFSALE